MMKSILPNSRKHDISFHASGRIDISAHIAHALSLRPGDVIDIVRNGDDGGELYLCVKLRSGSYVGRHKGKVWATSNGTGTFRTYLTSLTRTVLSASGLGCKLLRCPCGSVFEENGNKYITIIYRCSL